MRNDKHLAIKLRKQGKSYKQIEKELEIPRSTLSVWFHGLKWSQYIKNNLARHANDIARKRLRLINKKRCEMWERWREEARQSARNEFPRLVKNPLFVAGIMLYWGEGDSKLENGHVGLSNTNANMLRLYARFLREICRVPAEKFRGNMILYPDLNEATCLDFWSQQTGIPPWQFHKTQYIKGKHPTKRLACGVFMIKFGSRQLKEKIAVWIDLFQQQYPHGLHTADSFSTNK